MTPHKKKRFLLIFSFSFSYNNLSKKFVCAEYVFSIIQLMTEENFLLNLELFTFEKRRSVHFINFKHFPNANVGEI